MDLTKLELSIQEGNLSDLKKILYNVNTSDAVDSIEQKFAKQDPLVFAIHLKQEAAAVFLLEKGFSYSHVYSYLHRKCDQWCELEHGPIRCPHSTYTARDLTNENGLFRVRQLMDDITAGRRKPGDGIHVLPVGGLKRDKAIISPRRMTSEEESRTKTETQILRNCLQEFALDSVDHAGCSLLHVKGTTPLAVYVLSSAGVPVNKTNKDGDTALHLAVRKNNLPLTEALLQCGGDLSIRNKLGQTPMDEADNKMADLLSEYSPGLVMAIMKGDYKSLQRLTRKWCSISSIIKDGKTGLQLATAVYKQSSSHTKCLNLIKEFSTTADLIHSVLSNDEKKAKHIFSSKKGWKCNVRFKDRTGGTLLVRAIGLENLDLVELLMQHGAMLHIRVRQSELPAENAMATIPLRFCALEYGCPINIAKYLAEFQDPTIGIERDKNGRTSLHVMIENGFCDRDILWLINSERGHNLTLRNKDGLLPRETAAKLGREDIVTIIDSYVVNHVGKCFIPFLPLAFYGFENLNVKDSKTELTALQKAVEVEAKEDIHSIQYIKLTEKSGIHLFEAAARGDLETVIKLNTGIFQDKNGYTALIRAIAFDRYMVAERLLVDRPVLRSYPDNHNRYPLHFAYALPPDRGQKFIQLLLSGNPDQIESNMDMNGRVPADYLSIQNSKELQDIIESAQTFDTYGKKGFLTGM